MSDKQQKNGVHRIVEQVNQLQATYKGEFLRSSELGVWVVIAAALEEIARLLRELAYKPNLKEANAELQAVCLENVEYVDNLGV